MLDRRGDWQQTFSGVQFWPLDPRPEDVRIEDVAHHLSNLCRWCGGCCSFYSVAEHSVRASRIVPPEDALWALLHDAAEAYVVDVPRPLKRHLAGYAEIEAGIMGAVCERFGLPSEMPESVRRADAAMLVTELRDLMGPPPAPWTSAQGERAEPLPERIVTWAPRRAKSEFLSRFDDITKVARQPECLDDKTKMKTDTEV